MQEEIRDERTPDRCPKSHEVNEGSADITATDDTRHRYLCLDCGHKWEGGGVRLPMPHK